MPSLTEPLTQAHATADPRGWQRSRLRHGLPPLTLDQMLAVRAAVHDGYRPTTLARAFRVRVQLVRWIAVARVSTAVPESEREAPAEAQAA